MNTTKQARIARHYEIAQYMLQQYLDTGAPLQISSVAKALNTGSSTVHAVINGDHGRNWDITEVEVPVRERSYGTIVRHRLASACVPSRQRLLQIIREQQQQLAEANGMLAKREAA